MKHPVTVCVMVFLMLASTSTTGQAQDAGDWSAKKSGWQQLTEADRTVMDSLNGDFKRFLNASKTELMATREAIPRAESAGFEIFSEQTSVVPGKKLIFNNRDRALILVVVGREPLASGLHIIGTHIDSPRLELKARPFVSASGFTVFKTTYHGGIKKYQWANVPLALVGRIDRKDGTHVDVSIGAQAGDPVFLIPDVAPHEDKEMQDRKYSEVFKGEEMDPIAGSIPGDNTTLSETVKGVLKKYQVEEEDFVSAELQLVPAASAADVGLDRGLTGSYGQDDKLSSFCALRALLDLEAVPRHTALIYLSDNEESGSDNNTGANSTFLRETVGRLLEAQSPRSFNENQVRHALHASKAISADVNLGLNPIFPSTAEVSNTARLGYGVSIKRYGHGFDANSEFIGQIRKILDEHHIPWQTQTPKVDVGTGGTIGQFLSREEIEVIDMGVPVLSMHSPYEISSKVDVFNFWRLMKAFLME
ncbi:MAG: peptidase M18 [Acidobacteriia bacterium]|nr:peptidase M18 [Terriglobia bacterium]